MGTRMSLGTSTCPLGVSRGGRKGSAFGGVGDVMLGTGRVLLPFGGEEFF